MPTRPVILANGSAIASGAAFPLDTECALSLQSTIGLTAYRWTLVRKPDGSACPSALGTAATATVTPDVPGVYKLRCVVTDAEGRNATDAAVLAVLTPVRGLRKPAVDATLGEVISAIGESLDSLDAIEATASSTQHVATVEALRAVVPDGNSAAILAGRASRGDGGGGVFFYDPSDTTTADDGVDTVVTASGARLKRVRERGTVYATHHGVVSGGDPVDYGPELQAAIDRAYANDGHGATVVLPTTPGGWINIATKVRIVNDTAHGNQRGVRILGAGGNQSTYGMTYLRWVGGNTSSIIDVHSLSCTIDGLAFMVKSGATADCAIDINRSSGDGAEICSANVVRRSMFYGGAPYGTITDGIKVGDLVNGSSPLNCEQMRFEELAFLYMARAGIYCPNSSGQAKAWVIDHCQFVIQPYGILCPGAPTYGKFSGTIRDCGFSNLSATAIAMLGGPSDLLEMSALDVESCPRFLELTPGSSSGQYGVSGARCDLNYNLAEDGEYIVINGGGKLALHRVRFETATQRDVRIGMYGNQRADLSLRECQLPRVPGGLHKMFKTGWTGARVRVVGCDVTTDPGGLTSTATVEDRVLHMGASGAVDSIEYPSRIRFAAVSPEGVEAAPLGSERRVGATRYVKTSGAAETTVTDLSVTLPAATINVSSAANFATSGSVTIAGMAVAYTGKTATSLTGCSGGAGVVSLGEPVTQTLATGWVAKD